MTNHTISKFREELINDRSRYIEKVTGNGVLLIAINACLFYNVCRRGAIYFRNRKSSKRRFGESIFQAQTLIGLRLWMFSLFIVADLFFVYFIHL